MDLFMESNQKLILSAHLLQGFDFEAKELLNFLFSNSWAENHTENVENTLEKIIVPSATRSEAP